MQTYDVIIAGYGPTGAVAANLLGAQGWQVLVVDPSTDIYDIPRAVHFDGEVMRIFQQLDLHEKIRKVSCDGTELRFINGRNWTLFRQDATAVPRLNFWPNDMFFNQPGLEQQLREGVARHPNVVLQLGWGLKTFQQSDNQVEVVITHTRSGEIRRFGCCFLLAADGASSPTRKLLGIGQQDLECDEPWLVVDWMLEEGTVVNPCCYQICDPARPASLMPCEIPHIRWEFMLNAEDEIADIEDESTVRALMAPHVHRLNPGLSPEQGELIRAKVYNFHALLADTFRQGRVFLLGDAAHQTPPFLGQGLCAGVRDAYNLCWKLGGVLRGDYPDSLLDTYTSERRPHVKLVIATAVAHAGIIQTREPVRAFFRDCYLMLGKFIPRLVGHLKFTFGWNLGEGLLDGNTAPEPGSPIGQPLPQSLLQSGEGTSLLSDEVLGSGFSLVGFDIDPATCLGEEVSIGSEPLTTVHLGSNGKLQEIGGLMSEWAQSNNVAIAVIRPDRQVYGICLRGDDVATQLRALIERLKSQTGGSDEPILT